MSGQNIEISIIETKDLSSIIININDVSSVIINIRNRVKKYNIKNNIILSNKNIIKYRLNEQIKEYKYMFQDPDCLRCICYCFCFFLTMAIILILILRKKF